MAKIYESGPYVMLTYPTLPSFPINSGDHPLKMHLARTTPQGAWRGHREGWRPWQNQELFSSCRTQQSLWVTWRDLGRPGATMGENISYTAWSEPEGIRKMDTYRRVPLRHVGSTRLQLEDRWGAHRGQSGLDCGESGSNVPSSEQPPSASDAGIQASPLLSSTFEIPERMLGSHHNRRAYLQFEANDSPAGSEHDGRVASANH